ncbi:MAG: hypothetical protein KAJ14_06670 [Candidatus Omnitrophica bacterium]|nr:hypothetical protein [Candidatus Omnitrophota bacterium]
MELSVRIKQLAEYGVNYNSMPLEESDKHFKGDIVIRFNAGNLEGILPYKKEFPKLTQHVKKDDGIYRILEAEVGEAKANKAFDHGLLQTGAIIESETHVILDFQSNRKYIFEMPSRKYLNPSFKGPFNHG